MKWPVAVDPIVHYGAFLKKRGLVVGSSKGRLSALAFASKFLSCSDFTGDFRIWRMLEGWQIEERPHMDLIAPCFQLF